MAEEPVDVFVVGGGINGACIARDAAGRGYSVVLAEMNDLASGTSSASTKLVHGGLRYLEYYKFRLVRESLIERETLWAAAPHIIRPMRFVLPHHAGLRPAWLLRLGLFIYDHIGGRHKLAPTTALDLRDDPAGQPLKPQYTRAFEYSDCCVDDARLVVLNAMSAAQSGARIMTRTKVESARREGGHWRIGVRDAGGAREFAARLIVNAAGPWVDEVLAAAISGANARNMRLVQGSHIVVRKKFEDERAYFFQNTDGRIFFAIPYENDFTLIGTTDRDFSGEPEKVAISQDEIAYLCTGTSEYFREPVKPGDVVWSYSGVRALYDDGASTAQEATRDYVLRTDDDGGAACINVFGGKITTSRRLAETVLGEIGRRIGERGTAWTEKVALPGGDFPVEGVSALVMALRNEWPFLSEAHVARLVRQYGTVARRILGEVGQPADLGRHFGADLYECEVRHLIDHEWARTADDILWRRTKLGLRLDHGETGALSAFMQQIQAPTAAPRQAAG